MKKLLKSSLFCILVILFACKSTSEEKSVDTDTIDIFELTSETQDKISELRQESERKVLELMKDHKKIDYEAYVKILEINAEYLYSEMSDDSLILSMIYDPQLEEIGLKIDSLEKEYEKQRVSLMLDD